MKIDRLYTLSQFVDLVTQSDGEGWTNKDVIEYAENQMETDLAVCAIPELMGKYNDFLKQPLTKDMFVNKWSKPDESLDNGGFTDHELYHTQKLRYEEAGNKVIFKARPTNKKDCLNIIPDSAFANFIGNKIYIENIHLNSGRMLRVNTISELSEVTKGQLKLKNVEL